MLLELDWNPRRLICARCLRIDGLYYRRVNGSRVASLSVVNKVYVGPRRSIIKIIKNYHRPIASVPAVHVQTAGSNRLPVRP